MIKLTLVIFTLALFLSNSTAWRRYYMSSRCIDCWGNLRTPPDSYFDGCNWCRCGWGPFGPRSTRCSRRYCEYNLCYKPGRI